MAIVGSIIKRLIDLRDNLVSEPDAQKAQEEVLQKLLKTAKDTEFGKHHNFKAILESGDILKTFAEKNTLLRLS